METVHHQRRRAGGAGFVVGLGAVAAAAEACISGALFDYTSAGNQAGDAMEAPATSKIQGHPSAAREAGGARTATYRSAEAAPGSSPRLAEARSSVGDAAFPVGKVCQLFS